MGLYNFQKRFAERVASGEKRHTIRGKRAHADKPGNTVHLYTGLRTKTTRLLLKAQCSRVDEIEIDRLGRIWINAEQLSQDEAEALAVADGFANYAEMLTFWDGKLPFEGHVIHWRYPEGGALSIGKEE